MKVGKRYYIISHAYYHYIGEVTKVKTDRLVSLTNVVQVISSQRNWTDFFSKGIQNGDNYHIIGDMPNCQVINSYEWPHEIPKERK